MMFNKPASKRLLQVVRRDAWEHSKRRMQLSPGQCIFALRKFQRLQCTGFVDRAADLELPATRAAEGLAVYRMRDFDGGAVSTNRALHNAPSQVSLDYKRGA
jgi:hypothetical protein